MESAKTFKPVDTKVVVEEALKVLKDNNLIEDFPKYEAKIMDVLEEGAKTEERLTKEMFDMVGKKSAEDVEKEMSTIIGQDRVDVIKKAFSIETYRMKLVKKLNGQTVVQVHRGGAEFIPELNLATIQDVEIADVLQWASIAVEIFMLVLSCVDIVGDLSEAAIRAITKEVEDIVRQPAFQQALNKFKDEWNRGGTWRRAEAIFVVFLKDTFELTSFWRIIKLLLNKNISTWEKIKDVAEVALMIVYALATEGIALISKIAVVVDHALKLAEKLANIAEFAEFKKTLE
ncbi:unnamed protein product [Mytilus edulis]|uniref:Uncharacterized protein n=1 Tax=Mytilus edulis TaxID=6550 RepID=A0A8S3V3S5_MYTED|nr:unnamed protein product [Mytilus edulis]